uniref:Uncharacterized protein n=1 Tax=Opuntia streptacantha TaxID=393608 RepID=A0A7C9EXW6_OPUST
MLKPKKPPDPSQLPLLCSSLPSLPSVSLDYPSLSLTPARSFALIWTPHRFSLAPFSRSGQLLACVVSTAIKRRLIASLTTLFERCSSLSKVLDATIGSTTPDRSPAFLPIRTRSRSVCLPAVSRFSAVAVVTDLIIQTKGALHEADGAALLHRPGSSLEQPNKQPPEQSQDCFRRNSPKAVIPMNGSRFARVASYCHNWPDRSVCIASCCSIVHSQTQGRL